MFEFTVCGVQSAEYWEYNDKVRHEVFALKYYDPEINQIITKIFHYNFVNCINGKKYKMLILLMTVASN